MSQTITVNIIGPVGSGKSALAGEIEILCRALGLDVEWPEGQSEKNMTGADWQGALELYKPRIVISEGPASLVPIVAGSVVKVTAQGIQFGPYCWFSHESITGVDADRLNANKGGLIARKYMEFVRSALATLQPAPADTVQVFGVKDGVQTLIGTAPMPARMKARELAREQFGHFEDGDGSDAELCFGAMEQLIEHFECGNVAGKGLAV